LAGGSGGGQVLEDKLSWKYNIKIDKMWETEWNSLRTGSSG
jgi:hypothetical protein